MAAISLPQDVLDRAIDDLKDDPLALGSCALVCHDWLHRSRVHLFSAVTFTYPIHALLATSLVSSTHHAAAIDCPTAQLIDHPMHVGQSWAATSVPASPALPATRARDRTVEFYSLLDRNPRLSDYVRTVTIRADKKTDEAETRWSLFVASHLQLARFQHLRALRLAGFALESFADLVPTVEAIPTLESLRCEEARFLPPPFSPAHPLDATSLSKSLVSEAIEPRRIQATSLKAVSLSRENNLAALLEQPDTAAPARALHGAQAFIRSGVLRSVTSLELFEASTVVAWLPIIEGLGPRLHHVAVGEEEILEGYNVFPSERETIVCVYDALRTCTSLRTLSIHYDAEDTISVRMVYAGMPSSVDEGPLISSYFFDEAVRLFSGASASYGARPTSPFPALQELKLRLITTVHSLEECASACATLAGVLASHDYPAFERLGIEIEEPAMLGVLFGDREADEAACSRKAAMARAGLFRSFVDAGIALDVAVVQRPDSRRVLS
ncbi:hypothetical protein C8T65DRAFT_667192 [Cerioporus squamosus]|nr:hypothetical protein C8T65DRAFT_667192 [Cerioporus squamosus]